MARISALQLAVPALDELQARVARVGPDGATVLDPAHVSLGYPWLDADEAQRLADEVAEVVASHQPIEVTFDGPERFGPDGGGRTTVWVAPMPARPIRVLGSAIAAVAGLPESFEPHCSMVRLPAEADPARVEALLARALPVTTVLERVDLHVQDAGGWRHARSFPLLGC